jgi:beta-galactosidase
VHIVVERPLLEGQRIYEGGWCHKWGWDNVVSHWSHEGFEGREMTVQVYSSCEEVELVLNGKSLGSKPVPDDKKVVFAVTYEPGELKAKGYLEGRYFEHILRTAGPPSQIVGLPLLPTNINEGHLVFVEMSVLDEEGILCNFNASEFVFTVSGPAILIALGNADPRDLDSLKDNKHRFYQGRALAALKLTDSKGTIRATIQSESLSTCHLDMDLKG